MKGSAARRPAFRGQPILLLCAVLAGWAVMRAATWDGSVWFAAPVTPVAEPVAMASAPTPEPALKAEPAPAQFVSASGPLAPPVPTRIATGTARHLATPGMRQSAAPPHPAPAPRPMVPSPAQVPADEAEPPGPTPALATPQPKPQSSARRWTADAWLLVREDTTTPSLSGRPSYGRSQAGAVLRYRLAPESGFDPRAFTRATAALQGAAYREVAIGLSARPLPEVPLRIAAELRGRDGGAGQEVLPAAFAVSELPPIELPLGLEGEAYAQGGYVGGDFATFFADGQVRLSKPLFDLGAFDIAAIAGAWGGAQRDAERLDVGPGAALAFSIGDVRSRLSVDYRFRVAGDAEPSSGPALTLSAGF